MLSSSLNKALTPHPSTLHPHYVQLSSSPHQSLLLHCPAFILPGPCLALAFPSLGLISSLIALIFPPYKSHPPSIKLSSSLHLALILPLSRMQTVLAEVVSRGLITDEQPSLVCLPHQALPSLFPPPNLPQISKPPLSPPPPRTWWTWTTCGAGSSPCRLPSRSPTGTTPWPSR